MFLTAPHICSTCKPRGLRNPRPRIIRPEFVEAHQCFHSLTRREWLRYLKEEARKARKPVAVAIPASPVVIASVEPEPVAEVAAEVIKAEPVAPKLTFFGWLLGIVSLVRRVTASLLG